MYPMKLSVQAFLQDIFEQHDGVSAEAVMNTPERVDKANRELLCGYLQHPEEILIPLFDQEHDEMVIVKDITFFSTCEHHLLPFFGTAHLGYIPDGKIVGVSKVARLIDCFSRRLQLQERLVSQIADSFMELVKPKGIGLVLEAEHTCMTLRGIKRPGAKTVTSAMRGNFKEDAMTRSEFLSLIKEGSC